MLALKEIKESFIHLLFPHVCSGCGNDILEFHSSLCLRCMNILPRTRFENFPSNPVEKIFWGRLPLNAAAAHFYFTKASLVQHLMHQFKYRGNKELGLQLGRMMGSGLAQSGRFPVTAVVPLPLFASREKRRGYNQAAVLCEGISEILQVPVLENAVTRSKSTETQTRKSRVERWSNMEGKFELAHPEQISGRHILLVDDVVTTGATLEACGMEMYKAGDLRLSIATLCFALK
jgi:ComF family protein